MHCLSSVGFPGDLHLGHVVMSKQYQARNDVITVCIIALFCTIALQHSNYSILCDFGLKTPNVHDSLYNLFLLSRQKQSNINIIYFALTYLLTSFSAKIKFMFISRRFDPNLRKLYNQIREGKIGMVRSIKSTSRDPWHMLSKDYLKISGSIWGNNLCLFLQCKQLQGHCKDRSNTKSYICIVQLTLFQIGGTLTIIHVEMPFCYSDGMVEHLIYCDTFGGDQMYTRCQVDQVPPLASVKCWPLKYT